jgi:hypothetical protein
MHVEAGEECLIPYAVPANKSRKEQRRKAGQMDMRFSAGASTADSGVTMHQWKL